MTIQEKITSGYYKQDGTDALFWNDLRDYFELQHESRTVLQTISAEVYNRGHAYDYQGLFEAAYDVVQFYFQIKDALS